MWDWYLDPEGNRVCKRCGSFVMKVRDCESMKVWRKIQICTHCQYDLPFTKVAALMERD